MNPLTDFGQAVEVQETTSPDGSKGLVAPAQKNPVLDFKDAVDPEAWSGSVGHYVEPSISVPKEKPLLQRLTDRIVRGSTDERVERGINIEHISKVTGLEKSQIEPHYDQFMKLPKIQEEAKVEYKPGLPTAAKDIFQYSMPYLIAAGAAADPIGTGVGLLAFTALDHVIKLQDYVPTDASDNFKSTVELADFMTKVMTLHGVFEMLPEDRPSAFGLLKKPFTKYFKKVAKERGLPDTLTFTADKLNSIKSALSPEEFSDFLNSVGLSPAHDEAAGEGVDIQIPTEKLFEASLKQASPPPLEIVSPVIIAPSGKEYTGADHGAAIEAARAAGEDVSEINRERDGMFKVSDGSVIDRKEAELRYGMDHSHEIPAQKPKRQGISLSRAIEKGSILSVVRALGGFSIGDDLAGELGSGAQRGKYMDKMIGAYNKSARGIDEVLAEAKEHAPGLFNRFETGSQLLDYFKNRKVGSEGEFQSLKIYEKERNEDYDREIKDLTERAIDAGISPDDIRALIKRRTQEGETQGHQEIDSGSIPEELKEADTSFDFGENEKEQQAQIPGTEAKFPEKSINPTDKNLIQESGELFDPDKKYSVASIFYSALERSIDQKMPNSASPSQVKGIIDGSGIPKDQLEWIDLESFLKGKDKVKKEDLLNYIRQNDVKVEEVEKSGGADDRNSYKLFEEADSLLNQAEGYREAGDNKKAAELMEKAVELRNQGNKNQLANTKFQSYQLPGGENYKELLLTLPSESSADVAERKKLAAVDRSRSLSPEEEARYKELQAKTKGQTDTFTSSHFDEPNVLAHIRFNDRTDVDGKKVLFLEEVQSDWHQKGRKGGYSGQPKNDLPDSSELRKKYNIPEDAPISEYEDLFTKEEKEKLSRQARDYVKTADQVPNAPFKKTWHELAMKRMLRYAAENGYDKIAWTTGEQQAERYPRDRDAEKEAQLKGMQGFYDQIIPSFLNKYTKKWGGRVTDTRLSTPDGSTTNYSGPDYSLEELKEGLKIANQGGRGVKISPFTGKEIENGWDINRVAISQPLKAVIKDIENGMSFSDAVSRSNNALAEVLGGKIEYQEVNTQKKFHSLDITDSMKMSVLYEGQRYSTGQPKNQAEQLRVIEEGRKLFEKLGHKGNNLVIEGNLKTDKGENALGWFMKYARDKGLTKIDPRTGIETYHHEMGHGILNLAYTGEERRAIFDEVKQHWGAIDDRAAEEMMMDEAKNYYDWVSDGKDPDKFFNRKGSRNYTDKVKSFLKEFIENIKQFLGFASDESNMRNLKQFYEDLYSGSRKEVTAGDKEMFSRFEKEKDPENKREILKSKPYYDKIRGLLSDRDTASNSQIPESFRDSAGQPQGSQIKRAGIAFKSGMDSAIEAFDKVFNPANAAMKSTGKEAYSSVIRAIHTPEAEAIGFDNARSAIMDMNFQEIEKFFNRLSKRDLNNFNLSRGEATDPNAQHMQEIAKKELPKSIKDKNLIGAVKEASDYVYNYLKSNGMDLNYFEDYFYGAYKDQKKVEAFLDHWQSTDRYVKEKTFPTIADAQAFGLELKDPNPITNIRAEMKAAALKVGLLKLKETQVKDGHNYAVESKFADPIELRKWRKIHESTFRGMIFDPDYADFVNSLLSTNKVSSNLFLSGVRRSAQIAQQIKFFGSIFHLRNVTKAAISDETIGMFDKEGYKNIIKSFKPIDTADPAYKDYVNIGGGHKYSIESQAQKDIQVSLEKLAGGGMIWKGVEKVVEGSKWIPASPKMTEWMFDKYIPAIKFNRYLQEIEVQKSRLGRELTDYEKINIIRTNQNFYGEMNERLYGRSGTVTSAMRFIFSAPGYAEGNFRAVFQSMGDAGKKITGKPISEQGQRNAQFIASSLFTTLTMATVTTLALTGQLPPAPKNANDIRDLFKARTGLKDGNGDDVFVDMMGYDNDFYAIYGNAATMHPEKIPPALVKRVTGLPSSLFRTMTDITTIFNGGKVYDYKGQPIYYETDDLGEKMGKFIEYEATNAGAISLATLTEASRKGLGLPAAVAGAIAGVRTVTSESVKETKKARTDIFSLEDAKRGKTIDLNKLYKENPDKAREEATKFNETQIKKITQILKKEGIVDAPPKKFFEQFLIKSLHGAGVIEGTTIESLFKKPKRKTDKIMNEKDRQKLDDFIKGNFS